MDKSIEKPIPIEDEPEAGDTVTNKLEGTKSFPLDYFLKQKKVDIKPRINSGHIGTVLSEVEEHSLPLKEDSLGYLHDAIIDNAPENIDVSSWSMAYIKASGAMTSFLRGLRNSFSKHTYHESFYKIQSFSNQDIVDAVLNSGQADWSKNPSYYMALSEEMILRVRSNIRI